MIKKIIITIFTVILMISCDNKKENTVSIIGYGSKALKHKYKSIKDKCTVRVIEYDVTSNIISYYNLQDSAYAKNLVTVFPFKTERGFKLMSEKNIEKELESLTSNVVNKHILYCTNNHKK